MIAFASGSPKRNMQVKMMRSLPNGNDFVAYIDAIGKLDGTRWSLGVEDDQSPATRKGPRVDWPDPQLICYSWISGISDVAIVAFVRKRVPEIQYLMTTISTTTSRVWAAGRATIGQIEAGQFPAHAASAFPRTDV